MATVAVWQECVESGQGHSTTNGFSLLWADGTALDRGGQPGNHFLGHRIVPTTEFTDVHVLQNHPALAGAGDRGVAGFRPLPRSVLALCLLATCGLASARADPSAANVAD